MPVKKENYKTVPINLEHPLHNRIEELATAEGLNRTKLLRMMVKFCLDGDHIKAVLQNGDKPPKVESGPKNKSKSKPSHN